MLPSANGLGQHFQDLGHSFSPYGPPSQQMTYIYLEVALHIFPYSFYHEMAYPLLFPNIYNFQISYRKTCQS